MLQFATSRLIFDLNQIFACVTCNRPLWQKILDEAFISNLLTLFIPFPLAGLAILFFNRVIPNNGHTTRTGSTVRESITPVISQSAITAAPLITASTFIGFGMGGFIDSIVLHQLLQWHQMISNILPPTTLEAKSVNMFWDGIFEAFTWLFTMAGIILLYNILHRENVLKSSSVFAGGLVLGWGIFNFMDGIFNHYIFKFHNVRENILPEFWNLLFLIASTGIMIFGWLLIKTGKGNAGIK